MALPPTKPKLYHITHVDNLSAIVAAGALLSDREMQRSSGPSESIGISGIKRRRMEELEVTPHPGTRVGDYVPFYFCPRSVMLYLIHRRNHPELGYRGGQEPIVHLEADLHRVVNWADSAGLPWAFSLSNAGAYYVEFRSSLDHLGQLNWEAIRSNVFTAARSKEGKQAEFLLHEQFPLSLVERVGVCTPETAGMAREALKGMTDPPAVVQRPDWYY